MSRPLLFAQIYNWCQVRSLVRSPQEVMKLKQNIKQTVLLPLPSGGGLSSAATVKEIDHVFSTLRMPQQK